MTQPITVKANTSAGTVTVHATGVFAIVKPQPPLQSSGVVRELAKQ
jgi:hypothetical protein